MSPAPRAAGKDTRGTGKRGTEGRGPRANVAVKRALRGESVQHEPLLAFDRTNYLLMASGVVLAVIGFLLLHAGDMSLAPLLLVVGYCGFVPAGILWRRRARAGNPASGGNGRAGE